MGRDGHGYFALIYLLVVEPYWRSLHTVDGGDFQRERAGALHVGQSMVRDLPEPENSDS